MANKAGWLRPIFQGVIGNALYALCVVALGGGVTYLSYIAPGWGAALLKGFLASVLLIVATVAWRVWLAIPPRHDPTTIENIEDRIKEWLFKQNLTIKNDPIDTAYFRLFIVTHGGGKIFIGRTKGQFDESISFVADLKATPDEVKIAGEFTEEETLLVLYELQLELSRANIAYKGLDYLHGFSITKMIPIAPKLGESEVMAGLWEVEAAVNSAITVIKMAALRHRSLKTDGEVK